jgi:signal transduction histidine kinase/response regulator RpfG family c-di-GMP phosphodiesterase
MMPVEPVASSQLEDAPKAKILIVDDDERTKLAVSNVLEDLGQTLVIAHSGEEALRHLLHDDVAVVLLDLHMPGMDGYETAALIRARKRTRHIPIVFLTAVFRDNSHLLQAYSAGAVDMMYKPVDPVMLRSKVSVFVDLFLKHAEIKREAELRVRLQEENFRVRTEKLVAEQALRRTQERQEAILKSLPVCFYSRAAQPPFEVLFVSGPVEQVTGYAPSCFLEDPEFGFSRIHPEDAGRVKDCHAAAVKTGSYSCEFRWRQPDGSTHVFLDQGVLAPSVDGHAREIFGTILDITEQRLLEQQLVQAQKMEAVGQLTGGIAHDFNNLLTVVLGNLDLMERHAGGNERMQRQLSAMRHAAERGQNLTGQLLAFSRRQHLHPETLDVNALVRGFEPLIRRVLGENVALKVTLDDEMPACEVDAAQLETSLLNLAVNARDAMPDGGEITLALRRLEHAEDLIVQHSDAAAGPWIAISMSDSGVGMPAHVAARAFEPFFTTKDPGKGSGLGLSQVYGFVHQSGGYVTLSSTVGEGTRISIYLPPSTKPLTQRAARKTAAVAAEGSETVLLVEDDAAVLTLTSEMLQDLGYRVITAADADSALDILRNGQGIDLIFTDVVMREKSGVQLAREAREMRPDVKILLTSGYTGESLSRHKPDSLDLPIIAKPFRQADLGARLRKILDEDAAEAAGD